VYHTGLLDRLRLLPEGEIEQALLLEIDPHHRITLPVTIPAQGHRWFTIEAARSPANQGP
jgi:hypothetical protein